MRIPLWILPMALLGLLSCTSGKDNPSPEPIDQSSAVVGLNTFLGMETGGSVDTSTGSPVAGEAAKSGSQTLGSPCITRTWDTASTPKTLTITYTNCTGALGTLNGTVVYSVTSYTDILHWSGSATFNYTATDVSGTKTWKYSGSRTVTRNNLAFTFTATNMTVEYRDTDAPANNKSYTYNCNLTATWVAFGQLQLYGTYSVTNIGTGDVIQGTIPSDTPLVWNYATCFCYPVSGTIQVSKNEKQGTFTFESCGVVKFNGTVTIPLPTCL